MFQLTKEEFANLEITICDFQVGVACEELILTPSQSRIFCGTLLLALHCEIYLIRLYGIPLWRKPLKE